MAETTDRPATTGTGGAGTPTPSRDDLFDLLGNARRRRVLRHLLEEPTITLTDLSARLAAVENGRPVSELTSRQKKQVYSSLYQTHIPRLSEHGLVEYDANARIVTFTGDENRIRELLGTDEQRPTGFSHQWSRYFLWTAVIGSAVIAGNWLGTAPATHVTTENLYGLLTVTFMMLSVSFVMAVEGPKLLRHRT
ncbi:MULTISPECIES: DUF7344 domain-containing protein [Halorussus]|uniref:DUF7344 domain-containing protein n=1 Tax=Halorussus TaxID=1070314 RepID=UPI0020A0176F|nr:hypothetical protein [Halorussus vallis]USZ76271.1 hypothetical protein NGM07_02840 [Halorussus vallis]